jgi:hypothetical protein
MSVTVNGTIGLTFADGTTQATGFAPGMRNRIINGDMRIDQRNAGSSITPSGSAYTVDRWVLQISQSSKLTAQQNAGSITPSAGFSNYLGITTASAYSIGSSDYFVLAQAIEGVNIADFSFGTANAKSITISFQIYSSLTGTFGAALNNTAGNRSYPFTYTISSANTWTAVTITVPGDTAGTWATNNTAGIWIRFGLGVGSTYSGTSGSWSGSTYYGATGATSVVGTNGATFYITGVQLESGTNATPFEYRQYGQELALCQRYYWNLNPTPYGNPLAMAVSYSTTEADAMVQTPVTMRTTPSLIQATSTNGYTYYFAAGTKTVNSITGISVAGMGISFYLTTTGLTAGQGGLFVVGNSTGSLALSAEL